MPDLSQPETTENPCPQCGTDLEPLRRLRRLPRLLEEEASSQDPSASGLGSLGYLAAAVALDPVATASRLTLPPDER